ncbi:MAG: 4Fe-4S dicluster domain-containing protein [Myxococcales bacterium]|nr:4Fe-4S dicluster domain-containing protein [Myxococcales bacterium]
MTLSLTWETCVKLRSRAASCRACVEVCPTGAISFDGPRESVAVDLSKCVECGLCVGECPTESFQLTYLAPSPPAGEKAGERGSAPLGALSVEDLAVRALAEGTFRLDLRSTQPPEVQQVLSSRAEAAREFLQAVGAKTTLTVALGKGAFPLPDPLPTEERGASRRDFLRRFVPATITEKPPPRLEMDTTKLNPALLRSQEPPPRRKRLLAALAAAQVPAPRAKLPDELVPFTSSKSLDVTTCTACALCVTTCPTGALSMTAVRDELGFDASACVKCSTCHDVCEPHALTRAKTIDLGHFTSREVHPLGRLTVKSCAECGAPFKHTGGEDFLCERCRDLDDEARALVGFRR